MNHFRIPRFSTSVIVPIWLQDADAAAIAGKTGLAHNTSGLAAAYKRCGVDTADQAITLADITTLGTFVSGGFKLVDDTNLPGSYEFHPPNLLFNTIASRVEVFFVGTGALTDLAPTQVIFEIYNPLRFPHDYRFFGR